MRPRVIIHNAVSLDGKIEGFPVDLEQYYNLAASFQEAATLAGSNTILKAADLAPPEDRSALILPEAKPGDNRPILVIPDSRGRIQVWHYLRSLPYWRHFIALCSQSTPEGYLQYLKERHIDYILAGRDHVDLRAALEELHRLYSIDVIRVDSGGELNGQLLRQGLVDEVSLLVYPFISGRDEYASAFCLPNLKASMEKSFATESDSITARSASEIQSADSSKLNRLTTSPISFSSDVPAQARSDQVISPEGMVSLRLIHMERLDGGVIWLRYEVR